MGQHFPNRSIASVPVLLCLVGAHLAQAEKAFWLGKAAT